MPSLLSPLLLLSSQRAEGCVPGCSWMAAGSRATRPPGLPPNFAVHLPRVPRGFSFRSHISHLLHCREINSHHRVARRRGLCLATVFMGQKNGFYRGGRGAHRGCTERGLGAQQRASAGAATVLLLVRALHPHGYRLCRVISASADCRVRRRAGSRAAPAPRGADTRCNINSN